MEKKVIEGVFNTQGCFYWKDSDIEYGSFSMYNVIDEITYSHPKSGEKFRITIEKLED